MGELLDTPVDWWWWFLVGSGLGVITAYIPSWYWYWKLRILLWQMLREARIELAAMKAARNV